MWIAQISDMHITREGEGTRYSGDTGPALARCLRHISVMEPAPAAIIASGDLANEGTAEQYARLRSLLDVLPMPVYVIPGNHDCRDTLRAAFFDHDYVPESGSLSYAVTCGALRLIALDTLVEGEDGGHLDAAQLEGLSLTLAQCAGLPTVVVMHHPPVRTGIASMDAIALDAASASSLGDIVERSPHIVRIVCGHVHRGAHTPWRGATVSICPSTAFQTSLAFAAAPFAADESQPSAYFGHYWNGSELVTHTINVPRE
jgi:3',5'-cyclic AMP phosphodiesterase CpdA